MEQAVDTLLGCAGALEHVWAFVVGRPLVWCTLASPQEGLRDSPSGIPERFSLRQHGHVSVFARHERHFFGYHGAGFQLKPIAL